MKPVLAIVKTAQANHLESVLAAKRALTEAEAHEAKAMERASNAREATKLARYELGQALAAARAQWPVSGPGAKRWSEFLLEAGIPLDRAKDAIRYAEVVAERFRGALPDAPRDGEAPQRLPTMAEAGIDLRPRGGGGGVDEEDGQTGPRIAPAERGSNAAPFRQLSESDLVQSLARLDPEARKRVLRADRPNLAGGSGETERGTWCTSAKWAKAVGAFDLDPFSNPRSRIASVTRCMLEDGGDAFGGVEPGSSPGLYLIGGRAGEQPISGVADAETRTFIQPPYHLVIDAIAHYGHTRFCALLRFSPDVEWFRRLWPLTCAVAIPLQRLDFDPPPSVPKPESSIPYPHALYYADSRDITPEVRALCQIWLVDHELRPPLHLAHGRTVET